MVSQIRQRYQAFHFGPLHRYHPNQTPPTLVCLCLCLSVCLSLSMYTCLNLKLNMYATKFNYLIPKTYPPLYSFSAISSFPQGPKISSSITKFLAFLSATPSFPLLTPGMVVIQLVSTLTHSHLLLPTQSSQSTTG